MKSIVVAFLFILFNAASGASADGPVNRRRDLRGRAICLNLGTRRRKHSIEVTGANRKIYRVPRKTKTLRENLQHLHYFCTEIDGEIVEFLAPEGTRKLIMRKEIGATGGPCDVKPDRVVTITEFAG